MAQETRGPCRCRRRPGGTDVRRDYYCDFSRLKRIAPSSSSARCNLVQQRRWATGTPAPRGRD